MGNFSEAVIILQNQNLNLGIFASSIGNIRGWAPNCPAEFLLHALEMIKNGWDRDVGAFPPCSCSCNSFSSLTKRLGLELSKTIIF